MSRELNRGDAGLCRMGFMRGDWVLTPHGERGLVVGCSRGSRVLVSVCADRQWWLPHQLRYAGTTRTEGGDRG